MPEGRRSRGLTWADVVRIARELPQVEEGTAYGTPALRVKGTFLCRLREDGESVAIPCDIDERPFLLEAHPEMLFLTPHHQNWAGVLVSLPQAEEGLVRELVEDAWIERAPKRLAAAFLAERPAEED